MVSSMLLMSVLSTFAGFALGICCSVSPGKRKAAEMSENRRAFTTVMGLFPAICGFIGVLWCFMSPPLFAVEVTGPPAHHRNDPSRSVYWGNGCFWHTQYDLVVLEQDAAGAFAGRSDHSVTSLVGYAGGRYQSAGGTACYHGLPGNDYSKLGHAEAVSITLDAITGASARAQVAALASVYFEHGFATVDGGKRQRLDPQDTGAEYRNVIGLPGGMDNAELWPIIEAANVHGMQLARGTGGTRDDTEDEYVVYVYDSRQFPFFRGESSHQFHANSVIGRPVPSSYTRDLKKVQRELGRLDGIGCVEIFAEISLIIVFGFAALVGLGAGSFYVFLPTRFRFWECLHRESSCPVSGEDP